MTEPKLTEADLDYQGSYELHPAGFYRLQLTAVDVVTSSEQYGAKPRLKLTFASAEKRESGEPHTISVYAAPSLDPRAKLRPFLLACGEDLKEIEARMAAREYATAAYIGRHVMGVIEHQPRTAGGMKAVVTTFQPVKRKPKTEPAPATVPVARPKPSFDDDEDDE